MANLKEIVVPDLGNIKHAEVIEVAVKAGDKVKPDDTLVTLESDKASMDIPSPYAGTVKAVKVKVGDKIATGSVIVLLESEEATAKAVSPAAPPPATKTVDVAPPPKLIETKVTSAQPTPRAEVATVAVGASSGEQAHAGPGVRRFARDLGVDLMRVHGTGPKDRILKDDVQTFVKTTLSSGMSGGSVGAGLPQAPVIDFTQFGEIETKPLTRIKKLTGVNLSRNWLLIPHVTQFDEADITELEAFRKAQQSLAEKQGVKLTPLVFLMKAVVACLKRFPHFNASLDPAGEQLILKKYFHIGVAVDTPEGLVVPVIRDVDQKGLFDLAKELGEVSVKARNKALTAADMQGSCFTISSLGGIGGTAFTPIVNLPDVAILGVSKAAMKPIYQNGEFVARLMLPLSLSYDHRVIDGAEGARFTVYLSDLLSDIRRLLL